jgi:hypothetical protein
MKGFSLFGAVIAIGIAGALSLAVPVLVAANISLRTTQIQSNQAYYSARGALEFAQRQALADGNPATLPARNFKNAPWNFTRADGTIQIAATSGSASNSFTMLDPNPPQSNCLTIDTSAATLDISNNNRLLGVTLSRKPACNESNFPVTIVSMLVSWTSDPTRRLRIIRIDGIDRYNGSGTSTGQLTTFTTTFTLNASTIYPIDYLEWNSITSASQVTMTFNMSDGTSKTAVAN